MDTGESQPAGDRFLPEDISDGGVPPVHKFESSDEEEEDMREEEGVSEPEVLGKAPRNGGAREPSGAATKRCSRSRASLRVLTRRFLRLMQEAPGCSVDLSHVSTLLQTQRRRLYDITNALYGAQVIEKESKNRVRWIGKFPISVFLSNKAKELEKLKRVESTLDGLIKSCAQQLFDMTDNVKYSMSAYVTLEDIRLLQAFQDQTVIAVRAPEETKLDIPVPTEESVRVHLKASQGPITVVTCELGSGHVPGSSTCFLPLEESRIGTRTQKTDSRSSAQDL